MPAILLPSGRRLAEGTGEERMAFLFKERPVCDALMRAMRADPGSESFWEDECAWRVTVWTVVVMFWSTADHCFPGVLQEHDMSAQCPLHFILRAQQAPALRLLLRNGAALFPGNERWMPVRSRATMRVLYRWMGYPGTLAMGTTMPRRLFCRLLDEIERQQGWDHAESLLRPDNAATAWLIQAMQSVGTDDRGEDMAWWDLLNSSVLQWTCSWYYRRHGPGSNRPSDRTSVEHIVGRIMGHQPWRNPTPPARFVNSFLRACNSVWPVVNADAIRQRYGVPSEP